MENIAISIKSIVLIIVTGGVMNPLRSLLAKFVIRIAKKKKEKIITLLNAKIDLPKLDEEQEKRIIENIFNIIIETLDVVILNKK